MGVQYPGRCWRAAAGRAEHMAPFTPEPVTIGETGLDTGLLGDIVLKALYYAGQATPGQLGAMLALSQPVIQEVMHFLSRGKLCEVMGSEGRGPTSYRYRLSDTGAGRAA